MNFNSPNRGRIERKNAVLPMVPTSSSQTGQLNEMHMRVERRRSPRNNMLLMLISTTDASKKARSTRRPLPATQLNQNISQMHVYSLRLRAHAQDQKSCACTHSFMHMRVERKEESCKPEHTNAQNGHAPRSTRMCMNI